MKKRAGILQRILMSSFALLLACVLIIAGMVVFIIINRGRIPGAEHNPIAEITINNEAESRRITAEDARIKMLENPGAFILDVRDAHEFAISRIPDAVLIPHDTIDENTHMLPDDKDSLILVYCRSGVRSAYAVGRLVQLGFTNVYDFGGINNWPFVIDRSSL